MNCYRCGHLDINHSDLSLSALGNCYECECKEYVIPPDEEGGEAEAMFLKPIRASDPIRDGLRRR